MAIPATTRRAIVGAAWSVPVVAAVGTAPAFAASVPSCSPAWGKRPRGDAWDFIVYPGCSTAAGKPSLPDSVTINGKPATARVDDRGRTYYDLRRQPHSWTFRVRIVVDNVVTFDRVVDVRNSSLPA